MKIMKIGDAVERIYNEHHGMKIGDRATVIGRTSNTSACVNLDRFRGGHSTKNLKVIKEGDELSSIINSVVDEIKGNV